MSSQSRKTRKPRGKKRGNRAPKAWAPESYRSATHTPTRVAPDELDVKIMFRNSATVTNGAAPFAAKVFRTNAAYDVDPALGSTESYGFDEYAAIYSYYRVIGYSYQITMVNDTTANNVPIMAYVLNTNTDPTVAGTSFYLYSTNPHCQSRMISHIAPNAHTFRGRHSISSIVGSPMVETADSFRSLTTGIPSDLTFLTIGAETIGGTTPTINVFFDFRLTMHVRFFARNVDLSLAALASRLNTSLSLRADYHMQKEAAERKAQIRETITHGPPTRPNQNSGSLNKGIL